MIDDKLKRLIFDKLYNDLSNVEIIPHKDETWFIDREKKYWYFEYEKNGLLWWNYQFCMGFFSLFSMERLDFQKVISEWVEEVLNCKVGMTFHNKFSNNLEVEEVLNYKVGFIDSFELDRPVRTEEVLNHKVERTEFYLMTKKDKAEEVLNIEVNSTYGVTMAPTSVDLILERTRPQFSLSDRPEQIEQVLNHKVKDCGYRANRRWEEVG